MAKISKSLMLNPDLASIIEAHQAATGVSFTRIMTAAVIHYVYKDMNGPDPYWMKLATAVERGLLRVDDLPLTVLDEIIANLKATLANINEHFDRNEAEAFRLREHYQLQLLQYGQARDEWEDRMAKAPSKMTVTIDVLTKSPYRGMSLDAEWQKQELRDNPIEPE